jgi:hypothetical protein
VQNKVINFFEFLRLRGKKQKYSVHGHRRSGGFHQCFVCPVEWFDVIDQTVHGFHERSHVIRKSSHGEVRFTRSLCESMDGKWEPSYDM